MKRTLLTIFLILALVLSAWAIDTKNCDYLTGGAQRALDYLSVGDLNNGDRAIVAYRSGNSDYLYYFKYDASGTTAENTSVHPYYIRPNDYSTAGVWYEVSPAWLDINASLTVSGLTVTGTNNVYNLDASGRLSGKLPITDINGAVGVTLSGVSLYGGLVCNTSATNMVTAFVESCTKGMSAVFVLTKDRTTGSTIWVTFPSTQTLINKTSFKTGVVAGCSVYQLSGTTGVGISMIAVKDNTWHVYEDGSPTQGTR